VGGVRTLNDRGLTWWLQHSHTLFTLEIFMPNWCHNRVSFYSDNVEDVAKLRNIFESDEPFNSLVPSPDWKNTPNENGDLPIKREHKNPDGKIVHTTYDFPDGKNDDRWYSWNVANWGTKWEVGDVECDGDDFSFECEFQTAWSPAEGIFYAIREKFPDVEVSWFYDEPGVQLAGYLPN
tara:strand:+ start:815 stop:1351 length:537 start_codon:yes stop_codon:yes gene_type:complete